MLTVHVDVDGVEHEVDLERVDAKQFRAIKSHLGLKFGAFLRSFQDLDDLDTDAIVAVLWLAEKQAGVAAPRWRDDVPWPELLATVKRVDGGDAEGDDTPKAEGDTPT